MHSSENTFLEKLVETNHNKVLFCILIVFGFLKDPTLILGTNDCLLKHSNISILHIKRISNLKSNNLAFEEMLCSIAKVSFSFMIFFSPFGNHFYRLMNARIKDKEAYLCVKL